MPFDYGVKSFNNRQGTVVPQSGDYAADYVPSLYPTDVASRNGIWVPQRSSYDLLASNLYRARAALAKARSGTGYFDVLCKGDSVTVGFGGGDDASKTSYPAYLNDLLVALGVPDGGTGWVYTWNNEDPGSPDLRWSYTSGFAQTGLQLWLQAPSTSTTDTATFTSNRNGTAIDLAYFDNNADFSYAVDGGAEVAVVPGGTNSIKYLTVSGLANTTHSVEFFCTTAGNNYAVAARCYQPTGLRVSNAGLGTTTSGLWADTTYWFQPEPETTTLGPWDLEFICLGINDFNDSVTPSTYQTNMESIISASLSTHDVILLVPPTPDTTLEATWSQFRAVNYDLADSYNIPLLDAGDLLGSWSEANANGLRYDADHLTAPGYNQLAAAIQALLT